MKSTVATSICFLLVCSAASLLNAQVIRDFVVVDSNGKRVGQVIGVVNGGETIAAIPAGGRWFPVFVTGDAFDPYYMGELEYPTPDCTGQAYANDTGSPFPISAISPTNVLYGQNGPEQKVDVNSVISPFFLKCEQVSYEDPNAVPMAVVLNLNVFVPPFKVIALPPRP